MAKYIFWFVWFIYVEKLKALALLLRPSPRRSLFAVVNGICSTTLDRRRCLLFYCVSTMVCSSVRISPIEVIFDLDSRSTCHSRTILQNRTEKKKRRKTNCHLLKSFTSCLSRPLCGRGAKFFSSPIQQLIDVYVERLVELPLCRSQIWHKKAHNIFVNKHQRRWWFRFFVCMCVSFVVCIVYTWFKCVLSH